MAWSRRDADLGPVSFIFSWLFCLTQSQFAAMTGPRCPWLLNNKKHKKNTKKTRKPKWSSVKRKVDRGLESSSFLLSIRCISTQAGNAAMAGPRRNVDLDLVLSIFSLAIRLDSAKVFDGDRVSTSKRVIMSDWSKRSHRSRLCVAHRPLAILFDSVQRLGERQGLGAQCAPRRSRSSCRPYSFWLFVILRLCQGL